jgi:ABC-type transport system involved in cytochrome bd biosynthesis fused ATPase/permease subunit
MGKIEALSQTIKPKYGTVLAILGYLQLSIFISIIVLGFLKSWKAMSIFSILLICTLIFTYRFFYNVINKGGIIN